MTSKQDIELELVEKYGGDLFPPDPVPSVLEVMERDRQAHLGQELFERMVAEGRSEEVEKVGKFMLYKFGIDLSAN